MCLLQYCQLLQEYLHGGAIVIVCFVTICSIFIAFHVYFGKILKITGLQLQNDTN